MRWYWIDRFLEFESGRCAKAVKNISLAEDYLHDHFPGYPLMPKSLIVEGMAQTGGFLVCEHSQFLEKVVLAKIAKVVFHGEAFPGDQLIYSATINSLHKDGAAVTTTSHKNGQLQAEMEVVFAHLNEEFEERTLFEPEAFAHMMQVLRVFEVGHAADGSPLVMPTSISGAALPKDETGR